MKENSITPRAIKLKVGTTNKGQDNPLDYVGPYLVIIDRQHRSKGDELNSIASNWAPNCRKNYRDHMVPIFLYYSYVENYNLW